jgi:hypothetical protein
MMQNEIKQSPDQHNHVTFTDRYMLGPIEKYRKKGIFPFKFMSHILLIFLTCAQILYLVNS